MEGLRYVIDVNKKENAESHLTLLCNFIELTCKLLKQIFPISGQLFGGLESSITKGDSLLMFEY